jgi:hypothetical protein
VRRTVSRALAAGVGLASTLVSAWSAAAPCVVATVRTDAVDERGRARLVEQLAASLDQHEIGLCTAGDVPLAEVVVDAATEGGGGVRIRVRDIVTKKEVTRMVRVAALPVDGRPLALALAADELLRASWAEILLARAPAPTPEPPPQVRAIVEASLAVRPLPPLEPVPDAEPAPRITTWRGDRRFFFGAALATEHATGGLTLGGADVRFGFFPTDRFTLSARVGGRVAPSTSSSDGSATASALLGGLGGAVALVPHGRAFGFELPIRVDVEQVQFAAHPAPGAHGSDAGALGVTGSIGAAASVRIAPAWRVGLEATVGVVLRPVEADDGAQAVTALSGFLVGGALGLLGEI